MTNEADPSFTSLICQACQNEFLASEILPNDAIFPSPNDKFYTMTCPTCSFDGKAALIHKEKPWLISAQTLLVNMERIYKKRFFHLEREIVPYTKTHWNSIYPGRPRDSASLSQVRTTLMSHSDLFNSPVSGMCGLAYSRYTEPIQHSTTSQLASPTPGNAPFSIPSASLVRPTVSAVPEVEMTEAPSAIHLPMSQPSVGADSVPAPLPDPSGVSESVFSERSRKSRKNGDFLVGGEEFYHYSDDDGDFVADGILASNPDSSPCVSSLSPSSSSTKRSSSKPTPSKPKSKLSSSSSSTAGGSAGASGRSKTRVNPQLHGRGKEMWCHQCKQKHQDVIICSKNCSKKYCARCLHRHYNVNIDNIDPDTWACYHCLGTCKCAFCKKVSKLSAAGTTGSAAKNDALSVGKKSKNGKNKVRVKSGSSKKRKLADASPSDRPSKKRALPIPLLSPVASRGATFTPSSTSSSSSTSSTPGKVVARLVTPSRSDTFLAFFGDASSAPLWASPSSIPPSVLSEFVSSPLTIRLPSSSFSTVDLDGFSEFQNNFPRASVPASNKNGRLSLVDLLRAGLLTAGEPLVFKMFDSFPAILLPDGSLEANWLGSRMQFTSLSHYAKVAALAAGHGTESSHYNGWRTVNHRGVPLIKIRENLARQQKQSIFAIKDEETHTSPFPRLKLSISTTADSPSLSPNENSSSVTVHDPFESDHRSSNPSSETESYSRAGPALFSHGLLLGDEQHHEDWARMIPTPTPSPLGTPRFSPMLRPFSTSAPSSPRFPPPSPFHIGKDTFSDFGTEWGDFPSHDPSHHHLPLQGGLPSFDLNGDVPEPHHFFAL